MLRRLVLIFASLVVAASALHAELAPEFPATSSQWINTAPLTKESTRGKAVFLWFFEET